MRLRSSASCQDMSAKSSFNALFRHGRFKELHAHYLAVHEAARPRRGFLTPRSFF